MVVPVFSSLAVLHFLLNRFWQYLLNEQIDLGTMDRYQLEVVAGARVASDAFLVMLERYKTPSVMRAYDEILVLGISFLFSRFVFVFCLPFVVAWLWSFFVSATASLYKMLKTMPQLHRSSLTMPTEWRCVK